MQGIYTYIPETNFVPRDYSYYDYDYYYLYEYFVSIYVFTVRSC